MNQELSNAQAQASAFQFGLGRQRPDGIEIVDATGRAVALVQAHEQAHAIAQLFAASADLLYGVTRAKAHLLSESNAGAAPGEARVICRLLRDVYRRATQATQQEGPIHD